MTLHTNTVRLPRSSSNAALKKAPMEVEKRYQNVRMIAAYDKEQLSGSLQ